MNPYSKSKGYFSFLEIYPYGEQVVHYHKARTDGFFAETKS
jgi:hypothetical protein